MKSFSYKTIETTMFGMVVTLEANGHTDDNGQVIITELFHCLDNTKYSQPLDDVLKSAELRGQLEFQLKQEMTK